MVSVSVKNGYIMTLLVVASAVGLLAVGSPAAAGSYFNSSEPGCDGSDPNVLLCEDFESGTWYINDGDHRTAVDKGWGGTIYANPITPPGAVLCGAGVTPFGNCVGNGGERSGVKGGRNMAGHLLKVGACGIDGGQPCGVDEIYVRWYAKWASGFQWSAEKHMNVTKEAGGIAWGNVHCNPGQGSRAPTCSLNFSNWPANSASVPLQQPLLLQSGRWYFAELYIRLNTPGQPNGEVKLWTNDCGVQGTTCGSAPVLRVNITNINFTNRQSTADKLELVWLENWANNADEAGSLGTGPFWDNLKVSRVGPIGFSGTSGPPPTGSAIAPSAPTNPIVR